MSLESVPIDIDLSSKSNIHDRLLVVADADDNDSLNSINDFKYDIGRKSNSKHRSNLFNSHEQTNSTTIIKKSSNFVRDLQNQKTCRAQSKEKTTSNTLVTHNSNSHDSILSSIVFDNGINILTISRIGTVYYCVEDLYLQVFLPFCTFNEFLHLITNSQVFTYKQTTLSEKIFIEQYFPNLKTLKQARYHLLPLSTSDYLKKLKQLFFCHQNDRQMNKIMEEIRCYKQSNALNSINSAKPSKVFFNKRSSVDTSDLKSSKLLKRQLSYRPFEQVSVANQNVSMKMVLPIEQTSYNSNKSSVNKYELNPQTSRSATPFKRRILQTYNNYNNSNQSSPTENLPVLSLRCLHRSKSLTFDKHEKTPKLLRSLSAPSLNINTILSEEPMIINSNDTFSKGQSYEQYSPYHYNPTNSSESPLNSASHSIKSRQLSFKYHPYLHRSVKSNRQLHETIYENPSQSAMYYQYSKQAYSTNQGLQANYNKYQNDLNFSPIRFTSILRNLPDSYSTRFNRDIPSNSCCLPCCAHQQMADKSFHIPDIHLNERMAYHNYLNPTLLSMQQVPSNYPSSPTLMRHSYPQHILTNPMARKTDNCSTVTSGCAQNPSILMSPPSTPNDFTFPNVSIKGMNIVQAITEHGYKNADEIPRILVRHTKAYSNKTVDTMGQLFPTWFKQPDFRCIHCFNCDHVFTPQQFMLHNDDNTLINCYVIKMAPIEILPSEKISKQKIDLWNEFCSNLSAYAKDGRIGGFSSMKSN